MKHVTVEDEMGRTWIVYEGDSGWNLCNALHRAGVAEVVLPHGALFAGQTPSLANIPPVSPPTEIDKEFPIVRAVVRRNIRLRDCIAFLQNGAM